MTTRPICLGALLAVLGALPACKCGPCMAPGQYELFARRSGVDGGGASTAGCPPEISVTLRLTSDHEGTFASDAGIDGTCAVTAVSDGRPRYDCQVSVTCTSTSAGPKVEWDTFAFNRPEYSFVDGFGGIGDPRSGMTWKAKDATTDCTAWYNWAAAPGPQ